MRLRFSLRFLIAAAPITGCILGYVFRPSTIDLLQSSGAEVISHDDIWFDKIGNICQTNPHSSVEALDCVGGVFFLQAHPVAVGMVRPLRQLPRLQVVGFHGCELEQGVLQEVARCKSLVLVTISGSNSDDAGLLALASIPALKTVDIHLSKITDQGIADFCRERPDVVVWNWYN